MLCVIQIRCVIQIKPIEQLIGSKIETENQCSLSTYTTHSWRP